MSPVLWILLAATGATVALLFDRRQKSKVLSLDEWAEQQNRPLIRDVELSLLSEVEPLSLLAPVFGIERFLPARAESEAALFLVHCGRGHQQETLVLGVLAAPSWLAHLRIVPRTVSDVPAHLGYVEQESPALPSSYRVESFAELDAGLLAALSRALPFAGEPIRIELRPSRILVAVRGQDGDAAALVSESCQALLSILLSWRSGSE